MRKGVIFFKAGIILIFLSLLVSSSLQAARTKYVTESTWMNIRSGPIMDSKVVGRVKSGDALEILKEEEGWSYVRTASGTEGWMVSSLLKEEKPAFLQMAEITRTTEEQSQLLVKLTKENEILKQHVQTSQKEQEELKRLQNENKQLKDRQKLIWVALGAGILLLGWVLGLITSRLSGRGRNKYRYSID